MRILIIEDEAIIAESLYQLLHLLDYDPYQPVDNPDDAISAIKNHAPDLIILDLDLKQDSSGLEVITYLHHHKLNIPFILLASNGDATTIVSVKKYKPGAFLIKPFRRESLLAAIELLAPDETDTDLPGDNEIFLKTGTRYEKLDLTGLIYIKASGKYSELHFSFGKRLIRMPLSSFIEENSSVKFIRVHKTYAVNPEFITSFTADELALEKCRIPIGRYFRPQVNHYLQNRSFGKKK